MRFHDHLQPGGLLVMPFMSKLWRGRRTPPQMEWCDWYKLGEAQRPEDGATIRRWTRARYDHDQQLEHEENRYEILQGGVVTQTEHLGRSPCVRWYSQAQATRAPRTERVHCRCDDVRLHLRSSRAGRHHVLHPRDAPLGVPNRERGASPARWHWVRERPCASRLNADLPFRPPTIRATVPPMTRGESYIAQHHHRRRRVACLRQRDSGSRRAGNADGPVARRRLEGHQGCQDGSRRARGHPSAAGPSDHLSWLLQHRARQQP